MKDTRTGRNPASDPAADETGSRHMQQCCNCDAPAACGMASGTADGTLLHRPLPLCMECAIKIERLFNTPASFGALLSLCHEMTQRTGEDWTLDRHGNGRG